MFKNATIYRIELPSGNLDADKLPQFTPCGQTQEKSCGWVPPRGEANGSLIENIGGQIIMKLMIETKAVPADAIAKLVGERAAAIEESTGRKPGKKERRELADNARLELLPGAFPKQHTVTVWINRSAGLLVLDTASQARADEAVSAIVVAIEGSIVTLLQTATNPEAGMLKWLIDYEAPHPFDLGRDCELKADNEMKTTVRYANHGLDTNEIKDHIRAGLAPTKLAMNWNGRVDFVLTNSGHLTKLKFLDAVFDGAAAKGPDNFDSNVAIFTGEMNILIADLVDALGGLFKAQEAA